MRVMVADDHAMFRAGLIRLLEEVPTVEVVAEAASGPQAVHEALEHRPEVVLLDTSMPGRGASETLQELRRRLPEVRVLVLISDVEDPRAIRLLGQGAAGFLTKDAPLEQLLVAIAEVHAGGSYLAPALAKRLDGALPPGVRRKPHHLLSDREYQVMVLLCSGKTPTRIAEELGLSVKTVSTYRTRTCAKMGFTNKTDLLVYGLREGLVG